MRRFLPLLLVFLLGCSGTDPAMEEALEIRSRLLAASDIRFQAEVGADYIDSIERFTLECAFDGTGRMTFVVEEPEDIAGLSGSCTGSEGTVEFDDTVLAFPLMADGRLSPLAGPWVLVKALKEGAITEVSREGELLHLTVDDSYADDALTVDVWLENGIPEEAEIAWEGRRCLTMDIDDFSATA